MTKPYNEACKSSTYKLVGHGDRQIRLLMESFNDVDLSTDADLYGTGSIINDFENEIAQLLGKEAAVFFPSGTMAQQIALRIWSDMKELKTVVYHPLCHLEIHEKDGLKELHHLEPILLGTENRLFTLEDLRSLDIPIACLLIELPQREIGGLLPTWDELVEISRFCKENDILLHLDGARLFESLPYYNKSASDVCSLFDSVYISFYKGLGGIAGAMLAGGSELTEKSKIWKRRHGGDLISLYPYIINAKYCMDSRVDKMGEYWQNATTVAQRLNEISGIRTVPEVPVCNMFHAYFDASKETMESIFSSIIEAYDICLIGNVKSLDSLSSKSEFYFGDSFHSVPEEILIDSLNHLELKLGKLKG